MSFYLTAMESVQINSSCIAFLPLFSHSPYFDG